MQPRIVVTAGAVIRDAAGRVLLQQRSDYGDWGLPGGAMEPGETIEQTMLREVAEETGLVLDTYRFLGVYSGPRMHYEYPDGNRVVFVMFLFEAEVGDWVTLTTNASEGESLALRFFDLTEVAMGTINPVQRPVLEDLKKGLPSVLRT